MAASSPAQPNAPFDQRVLDVVALIPRGRLATYGQVADWIGAYGCARQVGWALRRLPLPSDLPWHRVVNAAGGISPRDGLAEELQRRLLQREGVRFDARGRIDLDRYRWNGKARRASQRARGAGGRRRRSPAPAG